jgi:hypothetical protein
MSFKVPQILTSVALLSALSVFAVEASASIRVRCEVRSDRSRASVDGNNLKSGKYTARIESGSNSKDSKKAQRTIGDEVEFDFDSNTGEGGTRIDQNFIVDGQLTGMLINKSGNVVERDTVNCERD